MEPIDIAQIRNIDVVNSFFDGIRRFGKASFTQENIIQMVMDSGAPRFYVTYERARRYISMIERGMPLPFQNRNKISMYMELYRRYKIAKQKYKLSGYAILEDIIHEKAPSFYIELKTFREIIYKYHKENKGRCLL